MCFLRKWDTAFPPPKKKNAPQGVMVWYGGDEED